MSYASIIEQSSYIPKPIGTADEPITMKWSSKGPEAFIEDHEPLNRHKLGIKYDNLFEEIFIKGHGTKGGFGSIMGMGEIGDGMTESFKEIKGYKIPDVTRRKALEAKFKLLGTPRIPIDPIEHKNIMPTRLMMAEANAQSHISGWKSSKYGVNKVPLLPHLIKSAPKPSKPHRISEETLMDVADTYKNGHMKQIPHNSIGLTPQIGATEEVLKMNKGYTPQRFTSALRPTGGAGSGSGILGGGKRFKNIEEKFPDNMFSSK